MQVYTGKSLEKESAKALSEAISSWPWGLSPDLVLVFHSSEQDSAVIASLLAKTYPKAQIAGCSTAGEHLNGQHSNGSLVVTAIISPKIRWQVSCLKTISKLDEVRARKHSDEVFRKMSIERDNLSPEKHFCLTFIDGLSGKEESVSALMADAFEGIPLIGGSAGDDLKFVKTQVISGGEAFSDAAVFVFAESDESFQVLKHQHFVKTPKQLVVTGVEGRRIIELDGRRAIDTYADILGVPVEKVTPELCFANPVTFRINNDIYVRSIQKVQDDGSIDFFCAVEEGMVLEVAAHEDMEEALKRDIAPFVSDFGKAELFLACNCILRALEATGDKKHEPLGRAMKQLSDVVIGFDTYGEQLNGLHINQTLVGIAIGRKAA